MSTEKTPSEAYNTIKTCIESRFTKGIIKDICKKVEEIIDISELDVLIQLCEGTKIMTSSIFLSAFRDDVLRTLNQRKRMLEKTNASIGINDIPPTTKTTESRKLGLRDYLAGIYHAWEQLFSRKK